MERPGFSDAESITGSRGDGRYWSVEKLGSKDEHTSGEGALANAWPAMRKIESCWLQFR
jgi:hypothetical protein